MPKTPKTLRVTPTSKKKVSARMPVPRKEVKRRWPATGPDVCVNVNVRFDSPASHLALRGGPETVVASWLKETALYCIKRLLMFFHLS
jgi:hypothetical protein